MPIGSFLRLLLQRLAAEQVQQTVADNLRKSAQTTSDAQSTAASDDAAP